jgi:hypothetical protein
MATTGLSLGRFARRFVSTAAITCVLVVVICASVNGQTNTNTNTNTNNTTNGTTTGGNGTSLFVTQPYQNVGGISINTEGLLGNVTADALGMLKKARLENFEKVPNVLSGTVATRKVSLRRLEETILDCVKNNKPVPDAVKYLAGLQHIEYVFVYPEERDIVLVGPAEGWDINDQGAVVGITSRRPVMLLDDLLIALRTAQAAAQGGISCSIDPTREGLARYQDYMRGQTTMTDPDATASNIERALGTQNISIHGVPNNSHFARVLVAADYRMKRLAMAFDPSPVRGLPSYLEMAPATARTVQSPRFWLEPQIESLLRDPDGLAWELHGTSVKAMTEEDFLTASGGINHSGKAGPAAQKWADAMTRKYAELAAVDSIFGQLQNCMELAVVGALVAKERLAEKAGNSLPTLLDSSVVKTAEFNTPKQVDSKASLLKKGRHWVISASGGVAISSWELADRAKTSDTVAAERNKAIPAASAEWCWN